MNSEDKCINVDKLAIQVGKETEFKVNLLV